MKRVLPILFLLAAVPGTASADFVGLRLGVDVWGHNTRGDIALNGGNNNLHSDLGLGRDTQVGFFASFEHPIPLLPNIALRYNNVSSSGTGQLTQQFGAISAGTDVHSKVSLNQLDGILYYELLDNVVSVDAGLDVKVVQGKVNMSGAGQTVSRSYTAGIPMLYLSTGVALPFTGLSANALGSFMAYGGNRLYDVTADIAYESSLGFGAAAGYRRENLKLKDLHGIKINATIDGPFASVFYHF